jgi:large repetitive protein
VLDQTGHQIAWTLDWDSSKIATVALANSHIKVLTMDKAGNLSSATANSTADFATNNVPDYQVDVVPYVKSISRAGAYSTIRSKEGRYVLRRGEAITITGFNLINSTNSVSIGGAAATISGSTTSVTTTVPDTASSGDISYSVNGVSMPNNLNTNALAYNNEATAASASDGSALWTDDRRVHIWVSDNNQTTRNFGYFAGSQTPYYPTMTYCPTSVSGASYKNANTTSTWNVTAGTLYAAWSSYSASSLYTNTNSNTSTAAAPFLKLIGMGDPTEHTDIAWSSFTSGVSYAGPAVAYNGNMSSLGNFSRTDSGGVQVYSPNAPYNNAMGTMGSNNLWRGEELYRDKKLMQFINERIVTDSSGNNFVTYYDTDTKALKYAFVPVGNTSTTELASWVNIDGGMDSDDPYLANATKVCWSSASTTTVASLNQAEGAYVTATATLMTPAAGGVVTAPVAGYVHYLVAVGDTLTYLTNDSNTSYTGIAVITPTQGMRSSTAGMYSSIALTSTGFPVIAYYDASNQTVKIAHANYAALPDGTNNIGWKIQTAMSVADEYYQYSGTHIAIKIDSAGYLHMVFFRTSTGDLIYLKSTNAPTNGTTDYTFGSAVAIDSIGSVGTGADLTLNGTTPYVSYYDGSYVDTFNGLKMAYYDTANSVWECMNAPLVYSVASDRTSIEYNSAASVTKSVNAASTDAGMWATAIGYKSDDYYRVAYYTYGN